MAATTMARVIQLTPRHITFRRSGGVHFFTSSTSDPNAEPDNSDTASSSSSKSSFSSYFSEVKSSLKQQAPAPKHQQPRQPFSFSSKVSQSHASSIASLEEIRKNLSEFRARTDVPPTPPSTQHISFHELYKRNVVSKGEDSSSETKKGVQLSFDAIRESLKRMKDNQPEKGSGIRGPISGFKPRLGDPYQKESPMIIGQLDNLPSSVFGPEMKEKGGDSPSVRMEFLKTYSYEELGEKLMKLRPESKKGDKWFSLDELNERLVKLRELEEKETLAAPRSGGSVFRDIRLSIEQMNRSDEKKAKKTSFQRLDVLGHLGRTPSYLSAPPKDALVEKYFHPDNMSSEEKMKLELKKVRDEFKMSESDCGSARVQVAQLTTKIKHLSAVLHKKDKHSKKGLQAMVQRRKKLLKYLRKTDWDSYCLVLSKLGLRDNPDYKN